MAARLKDIEKLQLEADDLRELMSRVDSANIQKAAALQEADAHCDGRRYG